MLLPGYRHLSPSVGHEGKVEDMCVHLTFISKAGFPMWHHRILNLNGKVSLAERSIETSLLLRQTCKNAIHWLAQPETEVYLLPSQKL